MEEKKQKTDIIECPNCSTLFPHDDHFSWLPDEDNHPTIEHLYCPSCGVATMPQFECNRCPGDNKCKLETACYATLYYSYDEWIKDKNEVIVSSFAAPLSPIENNSRTIEINIPKNFMNCAVTIKNNFTADTNDLANWDTISFPLPDPEYVWKIRTIKTDGIKKIVVLIDKDD